MKAQSPLLGFNNNVKHKGRVFHIQTEDSGARHPHIITHLFADGGRILKTTKTSYAEHVGADRMADTVRALMKEQHKAMFISLRDGEFDHLFDGIPLAARPSVANNPATAATIPAPPDAAPAKPPPEAPPPPQPPNTVIHAPASRGADPTAATAVAMPVAVAAEQGGAPSVDVDLDTLERAAAEKQSPVFQQIHHLPPPPAAVMGKKRSSDGPATAGSYRTVTPAQAPSHLVNPPPSPPADKADPSEKADGRAPKGPVPSTGRYAPTRPAAIFANSRPAEGASIFGEDLISEKSLDEVILSYLAEDLDSQPPKK